MDTDSLKFLKKLLDTPGPSGFEVAPARVWRERAETFADRVTVDVGGNSVAALNADAQPRLMFAGHIDEIGLMIHHIDDDGFLFFSPIGGWIRKCSSVNESSLRRKAVRSEGSLGKKPFI